jgi:hypothetical protein
MEKTMSEDNLDTLGGYTEDDPEYWAILAKIIGNPVPEYEDDSEFIDENGVVIKEVRPTNGNNKPTN